MFVLFQPTNSRVCVFADRHVTGWRSNPKNPRESVGPSAPLSRYQGCEALTCSALHDCLTPWFWRLLLTEDLPSAAPQWRRPTRVSSWTWWTASWVSACSLCLSASNRWVACVNGQVLRPSSANAQPLLSAVAEEEPRPKINLLKLVM